MLFPTLSPVAVGAEHLAVFGDGSPAFRPRLDVIGLHFLYREFLAALRADAQSFSNPSTRFTIVDFGSAKGRES